MAEHVKEHWSDYLQSHIIPPLAALSLPLSLILSLSLSVLSPPLACELSQGILGNFLLRLEI